MGAIAAMKNLIAGSRDDTAPATPTYRFDAESLNARLSNESALLQEQDSIQRQIASAEDRLRVIAAAGETVATKRRERLELATAAVLEGRSVELADYDKDIAEREAAMRPLEREAEALRAAIGRLTASLRSREAYIAAMRLNGLRERVRGLEQHLVDTAPQFAGIVNTLRAAAIEIAAVAIARDKVGPLMPGNTPIGSSGLGQLEIPVPRLPAYDHAGGLLDIRREAEARAKEILLSLGVRA